MNKLLIAAASATITEASTCTIGVTPPTYCNAVGTATGAEALCGTGADTCDIDIVLANGFCADADGGTCEQQNVCAAGGTEAGQACATGPGTATTAAGSLAAATLTYVDATGYCEATSSFCAPLETGLMIGYCNTKVSPNVNVGSFSSGFVYDIALGCQPMPRTTLAVDSICDLYLGTLAVAGTTDFGVSTLTTTNTPSTQKYCVPANMCETGKAGDRCTVFNIITGVRSTSANQESTWAYATTPVGTLLAGVCVKSLADVVPVCRSPVATTSTKYCNLASGVALTTPTTVAASLIGFAIGGSCVPLYTAAAADAFDDGDACDINTGASTPVTPGASSGIILNVGIAGSYQQKCVPQNACRAAANKADPCWFSAQIGDGTADIATTTAFGSPIAGQTPRWSSTSSQLAYCNGQMACVPLSTDTAGAASTPAAPCTLDGSVYDATTTLASVIGWKTADSPCKPMHTYVGPPNPTQGAVCDSDTGIELAAVDYTATTPIGYAHQFGLADDPVWKCVPANMVTPPIGSSCDYSTGLAPTAATTAAYKGYVAFAFATPPTTYNVCKPLSVLTDTAPSALCDLSTGAALPVDARHVSIDAAVVGQSNFDTEAQPMCVPLLTPPLDATETSSCNVDFAGDGIVQMIGASTNAAPKTFGLRCVKGYPLGTGVNIALTLTCSTADGTFTEDTDDGVIIVVGNNYFCIPMWCRRADVLARPQNAQCMVAETADNVAKLTMSDSTNTTNDGYCSRANSFGPQTYGPNDATTDLPVGGTCVDLHPCEKKDATTLTYCTYMKLEGDMKTYPSTGNTGTCANENGGVQQYRAQTGTAAVDSKTCALGTTCMGLHYNTDTTTFALTVVIAGETTCSGGFGEGTCSKTIPSGTLGTGQCVAAPGVCEIVDAACSTVPEGNVPNGFCVDSDPTDLTTLTCILYNECQADGKSGTTGDEANNTCKTGLTMDADSVPLNDGFCNTNTIVTSSGGGPNVVGTCLYNICMYMAATISTQCIVDTTAAEPVPTGLCLNPGTAGAVCSVFETCQAPDALEGMDCGPNSSCSTNNGGVPNVHGRCILHVGPADIIPGRLCANVPFGETGVPTGFSGPESECVEFGPCQTGTAMKSTKCTGNDADQVPFNGFCPIDNNNVPSLDAECMAPNTVCQKEFSSMTTPCLQGSTDDSDVALVDADGFCGSDNNGTSNGLAICIPFSFCQRPQAKGGVACKQADGSNGFCPSTNNDIPNAYSYCAPPVGDCTSGSAVGDACSTKKTSQTGFCVGETTKVCVDLTQCQKTGAKKNDSCKYTPTGASGARDGGCSATLTTNSLAGVCLASGPCGESGASSSTPCTKLDSTRGFCLESNNQCADATICQEANARTSTSCSDGTAAGKCSTDNSDLNGDGFCNLEIATVGCDAGAIVGTKCTDTANTLATGTCTGAPGSMTCTTYGTCTHPNAMTSTRCQSGSADDTERYCSHNNGGIYNSQATCDSAKLCQTSDATDWTLCTNGNSTVALNGFCNSGKCKHFYACQAAGVVRGAPCSLSNQANGFCPITTGSHPDPFGQCMAFGSCQAAHATTSTPCTLHGIAGSCDTNNTAINTNARCVVPVVNSCDSSPNGTPCAKNGTLGIYGFCIRNECVESTICQKESATNATVCNVDGVCYGGGYYAVCSNQPAPCKALDNVCSYFPRKGGAMKKSTCIDGPSVTGFVCNSAAAFGLALLTALVSRMW